MNVVIFSLTILAVYAIMSKAYQSWKRADLKEKMSDLQEINTQHEEIIQFKKKYKTGQAKKQHKTIKNFYKE